MRSRIKTGLMQVLCMLILSRCEVTATCPSNLTAVYQCIEQLNATVDASATASEMNEKICSNLHDTYACYVSNEAADCCTSEWEQSLLSFNCSTDEDYVCKTSTSSIFPFNNTNEMLNVTAGVCDSVNLYDCLKNIPTFENYYLANANITESNIGVGDIPEKIQCSYYNLMSTCYTEAVCCGGFAEILDQLNLNNCLVVCNDTQYNITYQNKFNENTEYGLIESELCETDDDCPNYSTCGVFKCKCNSKQFGGLHCNETVIGYNTISTQDNPWFEESTWLPSGVPQLESHYVQIPNSHRVSASSSSISVADLIIGLPLKQLQQQAPARVAWTDVALSMGKYSKLPGNIAHHFCVGCAYFNSSLGVSTGELVATNSALDFNHRSFSIARIAFRFGDGEAQGKVVMNAGTLENVKLLSLASIHKQLDSGLFPSSQGEVNIVGSLVEVQRIEICSVDNSHFDSCSGVLSASAAAVSVSSQEGIRVGAVSNLLANQRPSSVTATGSFVSGTTLRLSEVPGIDSQVVVGSLSTDQSTPFGVTVVASLLVESALSTGDVVVGTCLPTQFRNMNQVNATLDSVSAEMQVAGLQPRAPSTRRSLRVAMSLSAGADVTASLRSAGTIRDFASVAVGVTGVSFSPSAEAIPVSVGGDAEGVVEVLTGGLHSSCSLPNTTLVAGSSYGTRSARARVEVSDGDVSCFGLVQVGCNDVAPPAAASLALEQSVSNATLVLRRGSITTSAADGRVEVGVNRGRGLVVGSIRATSITGYESVHVNSGRLSVKFLQVQRLLVTSLSRDAGDPIAKVDIDGTGAEAEETTLYELQLGYCDTGVVSGTGILVIRSSVVELQQSLRLSYIEAGCEGGVVTELHLEEQARLALLSTEDVVLASTQGADGSYTSAAVYVRERSWLDLASSTVLVGSSPCDDATNCTSRSYGALSITGKSSLRAKELRLFGASDVRLDASSEAKVSNELNIADRASLSLIIDQANVQAIVASKRFVCKGIVNIMLEQLARAEPVNYTLVTSEEAMELDASQIQVKAGNDTFDASMDVIEVFNHEIRFYLSGSSLMMQVITLDYSPDDTIFGLDKDTALIIGASLVACIVLVAAISVLTRCKHSSTTKSKSGTDKEKLIKQEELELTTTSSSKPKETHALSL